MLQLLIFDYAEQLKAILSNEGIDSCPILSAFHSEKLNGENILNFKIPTNHSDSLYVIEGSYAAYKDRDDNWQVFEIKKITDYDGSGSSKSVYCEHVIYELMTEIIQDIRPENTTATLSLTQVLTGTRWVAGTVDALGNNSESFYYEPVLLGVVKTAVTWGGEFYPSLTISGNAITTRSVNIVAQRGTVTNKQFVIGKDIKEIERTVDFTGVYTAIYPRGKGEEVDTGGFGRRITIKDVIWTNPPKPTAKPVNQLWIGDDTAKALYGYAGGTRHRYGLFENEETDVNLLIQQGWDYLQTVNKPRISYAMKVVLLEELSPTDYPHEAVRLGDTNIVIDFNFTPELQVQVRVIEMIQDLLDPDNTDVTLGNFKPNISDDSILQQALNKKVGDNSQVWDNATALKRSLIDTAAFELQNTFRDSGSWWEFIPGDGIYFYNNSDFALATSCMKISGIGFQIANSKTSGAWNFRTFGTGAGFVADLMIAGTLLTSAVKIQGDTNFYWDGTNIYIINPNNTNQQVRIGKFDGTNYGIGFTQDNGVTFPLQFGTELSWSANSSFYTDFSDVSKWVKKVGTGTIESTSVTDAKTGGYVGRAMGYVWMEYPVNIPYDPDVLYRVSVRVRQNSDPTIGGKLIYAGVAGIGADGVTYVNVNGANDATANQYYFADAAGSLTAGAGWTTFVGYFKGTATPPLYGQHADPTLPGSMHPNVRYFRPLFILNYTGGNGVADIDMMTVEIMEFPNAIIDTAKIKQLTFDKCVGGTAILGGAGNGNGVLSIRDAGGVERARGDNTGFLVNNAYYNIIDRGLSVVNQPSRNLIEDPQFEYLNADLGTLDTELTAYPIMSSLNAFWTINNGTRKVLVKNVDTLSTLNNLFSSVYIGVTTENTIQTTYIPWVDTAPGCASIHVNGGGVVISAYFYYGSKTYISHVSSTTAIPSDWTRYGLKFTPPSGTRFVIIKIAGVNSASTATYSWITGAQLEYGANHSVYNSVPVSKGGAVSSMMAKANANQSFTAQTFTKVNYNVSSFDFNFEYDTTNSNFTAKRPGLYRINGGIGWPTPPSTQRSILEIWVNGSANMRISEQMYGAFGNFGGGDVWLNTGDVVELRTYVTTAVTSDGATNQLSNYFEITKIL